MTIDCVKVKPGMEVASLSDVGRQRKNNEDSVLYWEPEGDEEFQRKGRLAVIADGMGGYEGGQEASSLAVQTVREVYEKVCADDPQAALLASFAEAHTRIRSYAAAHQELHAMGTTCTAIAVVGLRLFFAHVGDSRLYLIRGADVSRLTRDHSYVGRLVESGIVRSEDAERHPQRHVLTAALGSGREVAADIPKEPLTVEPGDALVLCTDGLWSQVSEQEISRLVQRGNAAEACSGLVELALERGGSDNITVQVLRVSE
jgi:protein phosphatase